MKSNIEHEITQGQRWCDTPLLIRDISKHNPIVRAIINAYMAEQIVTREEALCRMVVELSKDWRDEQRRAYETAMHVMNAPYYKKP